MHDLKWSAAEKKLARRVFVAALAAELVEIMADFKARAAAVAEPQEMWPLQEQLERKQREIERKCDYRYSQLFLVFARLIREGRWISCVCSSFGRWRASSSIFCRSMGKTSRLRSLKFWDRWLASAMTRFLRFNALVQRRAA